MEQNGSDIVISTSGIYWTVYKLDLFENPFAKGTRFRFSLCYVGYSNDLKAATASSV